jgi:hypothetical protein
VLDATEPSERVAGRVLAAVDATLAG